MPTDEMVRTGLASLAVGPSDAEPDDKLAQERAHQFQALEYNRLKVEAQQAQARHLISQGDYDSYVSGDKSNVIQRTLGLANKNNNGGVLETIGDVLSLPNYLAGSVSKATVQSGVDLGPFKVGFTPSAFMAAWHDKTDYTKLFDEYDTLGEEGSGKNLAGGIAADILLDPMTYLTLGVSTGTKVAVTDGELVPKLLKGGAMSRMEGQADASLTRFGKKIYGVAAQELNSEFRESMIARNAERGATGEAPLHLLDETLAQEWHAKIGNYMVEHFDDLKAKAAQRVLSGRTGLRGKVLDGLTQIAPYVPGTDANLDAMVEGAKMISAVAGQKSEALLTKTAGDMFQESSSTFFKERGAYNSTAVQRALASSPLIGKGVRQFFDVFDSGWDAAPDVVEAVRGTKIAIQNEREAHVTRITNFYKSVAKEFGDIAPDESEAVTRIVEARGMGTDAGLGAFAPLHPKMQKLVDFFESEMDDVLKSEQKAGFKTGTVEGYINHVYKDQKAREIVQDIVLRRAGLDNIKSVNKFTQQRMIATINDAESLYGKGALMLDSYKLLGIRRGASVDLINTNKLLTRIARDHGVLESVVSDLEKGVPDGMLRAMMNRVATGVHEVFQTDQVYRKARGNLSKLGFVEGDTSYNRKLLEYLSQPNTTEGKFSPKWRAVAEAEGYSEDAKLHFIPGKDSMPPTFRWKEAARDKFDVGAGGKIKHLDGDGFKDMPVQEALKMLEDPNHVGWKALFQQSAGGEEQKLARARGFLGGLDRYTKKYLDSPLEGFMPDVRERVEKAWNAVAHKGTTPVADAAIGVEATARAAEEKSFQGFHSFMDRLAAPRVIRKLEPQLPQELLDYARIQRRRYGIFTDTVEPSKLQRQEIEELAGKVGFEARHLRKLGAVLWDGEKPTTMGQADQLIWLLRGQAGLHAENPSVKYVFEFTPNEGNHLAQPVDTALQMAEGDVSPASDLGRSTNQIGSDFVKAGEVPPPTAVITDGGKSVPRVAASPATDKLASDIVDAKQQAGEHLPNNLAAVQQRIKDLQQAKAAYQSSMDEARAKLSSYKVKYAEAKAIKDGGGKVPKALKQEVKALYAEKMTARGEKITAGKAVNQMGPRTSEKSTSDYAKALDRRLKEEQKNLIKLQKKQATKGEGVALAEGNVGGVVKIPKATNATQKVNLYLDSGTAKLLNEMSAKDIDPRWHPLVRQAVMGFDKITSFFKTNLLLPWGGTWARNAASNVAINYLRNGLAMFHPDRGEDYWHTMAYVLGTHTDMPAIIGARVGSAEDHGLHVVTAANGRKATIKELIDEAAKRGVFRASVSNDVFGQGISAGKAAHVLAGGAAGAAAGAEAGAAAGDHQDVGSILGGIAGAYLGGRNVGRFGKTGLNPVGKVLEAGAQAVQSNWKPFLRAGEMVTEVPTRMMLFLNAFRDTGSVSEAATQVYRHLNDWNALGSVEKRYIRRAIPFYNWTKLAIQQTGATLLEHPGRTSNLLKTVRDWNESAHVDPEDVPDFLHEKLTMAATILGNKYAVTGSGLPIEDVASIAGAVIPGTTDPRKEMNEFLDGGLQRTNFAAASVIEALTNHDSFSGGPITPDTKNGVFTTRFMDGDKWSSSPKWLQALVNYQPADDAKKATVNPEMAWLLGQSPVSRFINVSQQVYDSEDPKSLNYLSLAKTALGAAAYKLDPATGRYFRNKGRIEKMKNVLARVGALKTYEGFVDVSKTDTDYGTGGGGRGTGGRGPSARGPGSRY